jgi:UPF0755 protein
VWTAERRAALDSIGMSEREITTLASIIQAEARWEEEMPLISAVFHNRLRRRMRLQADPTVQYALESHQSRLLFSHIDSVADNPYNTYTHVGLPPGPRRRAASRAGTLPLFRGPRGRAPRVLALVARAQPSDPAGTSRVG